MGPFPLKRALIALVASLTLAACSQAPERAPLDQATWQPGTGSVSGFVVNRKAGTNVEGTAVTIVGTGMSAVTDSSGFFRIMDVPAGFYAITYTQEGYATAQVEGLRVEDQDETKYDTIQAEIFDPFLPVVPPSLNVSVENGDSFPGGAEGVLSFTVSGTVAEPDANGFFSLGTAGLGQSRGTSGYLNASVPGTLFPFTDGVETTVELSTSAFEGDTSLHVVAYDVNFNRTEVVRYLDIVADPAAGSLGSVTNLGAFAVTFGDTGVFGGLSRGLDVGFDGRALLDAVRSNDVAALGRIAQEVRGQSLEPQGSHAPQGFLDEVLIWTDVVFAAEGSALPTAFTVSRRLGGGGFFPVGQVGPEQICTTPPDPDDPEAEPSEELDPGNLVCVFRDASGGLEAGVEATYRIDATLGEQRRRSEISSVTPLPPFYVEATGPANNETDVSVTPTYGFSVENRSSLLYIGAIVLDRVHAQGSFAEWIALLADASGVTEGGIPHNFDGSAVNDTLQPFHGYDWQPVALTTNGTLNEEGQVVGENAVSVAADFFDLFGVGFGVLDGPVNTFSTGDGSF